MASLAISLLLAPLAAQAGTYVWTGTDPNTGQLIQSPTYSGGTITAAGQPPNNPPPTFSAGGGDYGASSDVSANSGGTPNSTPCTINIQGPLTATFTWQPAAGQTLATDPPPTAAIVEQDCTAGWVTTNAYNGGTGTGSADSGLPENVSSPAGPSGGSDNTDYSLGAGGASFSVSCSAKATFTGSTGGSLFALAHGTATVSYHAQAFPVILTPGGTTPDSSGNPNLLVGQQATGTVSVVTPNNGSSPCSLSNFQWNVSGTTFQRWSPTTPQIGTTPANSQASYENDGPIPATNPSSWYWNDPSNKFETVSCTVTVTPPAGDGSPFTLTATAPLPVNVQLPIINTNTNSVGYGYVGPFSSSYATWLFSGPSSPMKTAGLPYGSTWKTAVSLPATPTYSGTGTYAYAQIITPGEALALNNGTVQYGPEDGVEGLDGTFPYLSDTYFTDGRPHNDGDSPAIPVNDTVASAQIADNCRTYLMFRPPGSNQWVPLAVSFWITDLSATQPSTGHWTDFPAAQTAGQVRLVYDFVPKNEFPSWRTID